MKFHVRNRKEIRDPISNVLTEITYKGELLANDGTILAIGTFGFRGADLLLIETARRAVLRVRLIDFKNRTTAPPPPPSGPTPPLVSESIVDQDEAL